MNKFRFVIGCILLLAAVLAYFYINEFKDDKIRLFIGSATLEELTKMCDSGWGDAFNAIGGCLKIQLLYYSPWISGFIGIIFLAKAGPYTGYHGYGGAGSHNRPIRIRRKTRNRILIASVACSLVLLGFFLNANYDITVGNQKINDLIPVESMKKTINEISDKIPIKIESKSK